MKIWLQKKFLSILVLWELLKKYSTLKKAKKDPKYWIKVQNRQISKLVKYIYGIPFYRKRFEEAGVLPEDIKSAEDFTKLPPLTKEEYREWIAQETKDKDKFKNWFSAQTTGSTGSPLKLFVLPRDRAAEIANLFCCAIYQEKKYFPLTGRIFSTMVPKPKNKKISIPYERRMSSVDSPEKLVEGYNEAKPDFYYGNKTAILMIAQYALKNNIKLHESKMVGSISEALDDNSREVIEKAFGKDKLFDIYGCAEVGNFAVEKAGNPHMHMIWHDSHVVNLLDPQIKTEDSRYSTGQIMITSLIHHGFPVVNYMIGDTIELFDDDGVKYITNIWGRTNDVIKNEDGSTYKWVHIYRIMHTISNVTQFRVIQKTYTDLIFELAANDINMEQKKKIENDIIQHANEVFDMSKNPKNIIFEWHEQIPPDPNGKLRMLISEV